MLTGLDWTGLLFPDRAHIAREPRETRVGCMRMRHERD